MSDNLSDYPKYTFNMAVHKLNAFNHYIKNVTIPAYFAWTSSDVAVDIYTTRPLNEAELITLENIMNAYIDPEVWLEFDHVTNTCLSTNSTNSFTPVVLQTIIVSPYANNPDGTVMDSMKTVIEYSTPAVENFLNWDPNVSPCEIRLDIYNYTQQSMVTQTVTNINNVAQSWKDMAQLGMNGPQKVYKTIQIYGLRSLSPGSDCIWQFQGSVTNSNIYIAMNSLQQLFYMVQ